jgi:hypothetical protein
VFRRRWPLRLMVNFALKVKCWEISMRAYEIFALGKVVIRL